MVWGCMNAAGIGELQFIEGTMNANIYCDILKRSMIPSLRRLGRRAVFQHDNDPKHTSKTTTALLKKLRIKVICGASSNGRWRSSLDINGCVLSYFEGKANVHVYKSQLYIVAISVISSVLSHENI